MYAVLIIGLLVVDSGTPESSRELMLSGYSPDRR
jgi:hypothetical protein